MRNDAAARAADRAYVALAATKEEMKKDTWARLKTAGRAEDQKNEKNSKKVLTNVILCDILICVAKEATRNMREWRNWQTRTFEGRVDSPYGFKSRFSHHIECS